MKEQTLALSIYTVSDWVNVFRCIYTLYYI